MTIDKLRTEKVTLEKKLKRLEQQYREARCRLKNVESTLYNCEQRERLTSHVGIADGVKIAHRVAPYERNAWMNTTTGTLIQIRRKFALVDYGQHGRWRIPFSNVVAANG